MHVCNRDVKYTSKDWSSFPIEKIVKNKVPSALTTKNLKYNCIITFVVSFFELVNVRPTKCTKSECYTFDYSR